MTPAVVSAWIAEVQAERLAAEVELDRAAGRRNQRMSRDQLAALVNGLGNLLDVLASAAPEDKAEVYRRLGLQLTYDPARRVVTVESHLGPDGSDALPRGARPSGGPTSGAPAAEPVGESQCRRGDTRANPTLGADRRTHHPSGVTRGSVSASTISHVSTDLWRGASPVAVLRRSTDAEGILVVVSSADANEGYDSVVVGDGSIPADQLAALGVRPGAHLRVVETAPAGVAPDFRSSLKGLPESSGEDFEHAGEAARRDFEFS